MKRTLSLLLALVLCLALFAACGTQTTGTQTNAGTAAAESDLLARIRERGTLIVATEGDWSPWTYHDEADELAGFDVELAQLIASGLGVEVEFAETDWDAILAGVESGRFDIACNGVGYTEKRAEKYTFSDPYVYVQEVLVVRADNEDIHGMEDLAGKTTANSPNSIYADEALAAGAEVVYVNTLNETIQTLLQGRADATLNAKVSIQDYLREHPDAGIKVVYESEGETVCVPVRKGADTDSLMAEINAILQQLRDDGSLAALSEKYFGGDLTRKE